MPQQPLARLIACVKDRGRKGVENVAGEEGSEVKRVGEWELGQVWDGEGLGLWERWRCGREG